MTDDRWAPLTTAAALEERFPRDKLRLFPTQAQLFDFIRDPTQSQGTPPHLVSMSSADPWCSFSIELNSASSVVEKLTEVGATLDSLLSQQGPSLFTRKRLELKRGRQEGETDPSPPRRFSTQTRYFLALRQSFIFEFHCSIPIGQQHLYEIIREGVPCHLYLDVEQEEDYVPLIPSEFERSTVMQSPPAWMTQPRCDIRCSVRPCHDRTTELLLLYLEMFLTTNRSELNISLKSAEIIVLRSVPISQQPGAAGALPPKKFSQHYILRFKDVLFFDNRSVGVLVREFVCWLTEKASHDPSLHEALFFHGPPSLPRIDGSFSVVTLPDGTQHQQANEGCHAPESIPLRCIIDTSVYSRNRMFRCYGSTKLGKTAALAFDPFCFPGAEGRINCCPRHAAFDEELFSTFVGNFRSADACRCISLAPDEPSLRQPNHVTRSINSFPAGISQSHKMSFLPSPFPDIDAFVNGVVLANPPYRISDRMGRTGAALATHFDLMGEGEQQMLLYHVQGTRFCGNVQREHKSNGIYFVASTFTRRLYQKCFDPDCRGYKSLPVVLPTTAQEPTLKEDPYYSQVEESINQYEIKRTKVSFEDLRRSAAEFRGIRVTKSDLNS